MSSNKLYCDNWLISEKRIFSSTYTPGIKYLNVYGREKTILKCWIRIMLNSLCMGNTILSMMPGKSVQQVTLSVDLSSKHIVGTPPCNSQWNCPVGKRVPGEPLITQVLNAAAFNVTKYSAVENELKYVTLIRTQRQSTHACKIKKFESEVKVYKLLSIKSTDAITLSSYSEGSTALNALVAEQFFQNLSWNIIQYIHMYHS